MKKPIVIVVASLLAISQLEAAPGVTTSDVNFRAGPGTDYESLGVLPPNTPVEIVACDEPRAGWCAVEIDDYSGFVSARYLEERPASETAVDAAPTDAAAATLTEAEIDALVAPVALYPDALLSQVLVAATYPLDIVKAERWLAENEGLPPDERQGAAEAERWDESVATLAAGFPTVIEMLAADLDWTEALGDAVIADSEAVLDGVQRQRALALALGNLESNAAQLVSVDESEIYIAPADPEIVYVPSYDPEVIYAEPAPAPATTSAAQTDDGASTAAALAAGALAFTAGVVVADVFDDQWDYWYGPPRVDWDGGYFYPWPGYRPPVPPGWRPPYRPGRPGGGISIGDDNTIIIGRPGRPGRPGFDGDGRPGIDGPAVTRPETLPAWRPGGPAADGAERLRRGDRNGGAFRPDDRRRREAQRSIAQRKGIATAGLARPETRPGVGVAGPQARPGARPDTAALQDRLQARSPGGSRVVKPGGPVKPSAGPSPRKPTAFAGQHKSVSQAKDAARRGKASQARAAVRAPRREVAPQRIHKPAARRPPPRRPAATSTAFQQPPGGGRRVSAHSARGHKSLGRSGRGGRHRR